MNFRVGLLSASYFTHNNTWELLNTVVHSTPHSGSCVFLANLGVNVFPVSRSSRWLPLSNLDSGESLLCAVFDRTSAALSQIASSVLGLWLHQDL